MTEDEDIEWMSTAWRKRHIAMEKEFHHKNIIRNEVLEEVAKEFDKMPFGDTAASFAVFVRSMKR